jgi:histidyl-tRNA synthetase
MKQFQTPRGTRDFLPEQMIKRQFIFDTLKKVFESYGFDRLVTPAFEYWELLAAKGGGGEAIKNEIYYFKDKSNRELGLRFDLTAPMCRVLAINPNLPRPFKRYQMGRVWRYEEVKSGKRYREFWQCDIDTAGTASMTADTEIIDMTIAGLKALGFKDVYIRLNNRKVLEGMTELAKVPDGKFLAACRAIDKVEKFGIKAVEDEMRQAGLADGSVKKLLELIELKGATNEATLKKVKALLKGIKAGEEGIKELEDILSRAEAYGIDGLIKIDISLSRGLDYYTGPIFEAVIAGKEGFGSVAGGGRFDRLVGLYGGPDTPATGISFGVERLFEIMKELKMLPKNPTATQIFVIAVKDEFRKDASRVASELRKQGINAEVDLMDRSLRKQMEFVNKIGVPYTVFVGEKELKKKKFTLRDMRTGKENKFSLKSLVLG